MIALLGSLLTKKWIWYVVGGVLLLGGLWFTFGGRVSGWWAGIPQAAKEADATVDEIHRTKEELARTQGAVREMSKRIGELTREAEEHKKVAANFGAFANKKALEALELQRKVSELESARRALPPVTDLDAAAAALKTLGY